MRSTRQIMWCVLLVLVAGQMHAQQEEGQEQGQEELDPIEQMTPREAYNEGYHDARIDLLNLLAKEHSAYTLKEYGDWYLNRERFTAAMQHYLLALNRDPGMNIAHYRLAEAYALGGQEHLVMGRLRTAVETGFWGYEALETDQAFAAFRDEEGFAELVESAKANHREHADQYTGQSLIVTPESEQPAEGWPVMVFLHGWGDDHRAYLDYCYTAADQGWAGIAISGTHGFAEDSFRWDIETEASTHDAIQAALKRYAEEGIALNPDKVFLLGFSQGALHAVNLICEKPGQYAGGIVMSIGGRIAMPQGVDNPRVARRTVVVWGLDEHPGNIADCDLAFRILHSHPPPMRAIKYTHDGAHHFPKDWDEKFPEWLAWLAESEEDEQ